MPLNAVPATDVGYTPIVQTLNKRITFEDTSAVLIGTLPAGAVITGGGVFVWTAFDDGTTAQVNVGTADDADAFGSALDVSSAGMKALAAISTSDDLSETEPVPVYAVYAGGTGDATAGAADVIVTFVTKP